MLIFDSFIKISKPILFIQQNLKISFSVVQANKIMASLQSIFNEFDLDHSGFIDSQQLKKVAERMGENWSDQQIKKMMKGIDKNNDGKISFEEFKEWWTLGHNGKLGDLIVLKSKSLKAWNDVKQQFKEKGVSFKNYKPSEQKDKVNLQINFGENSFDVDASNTGIKLGCLYGADSLKKFNAEGGITNPFLDQSQISLTIKFPTDQPKKFQNSIREVIKEVLDTLALKMGIEISQNDLQKNDYLHIKMEANQIQKYFLLYIEPGNMVKKLIEQALKPQEKISSKLGKQFEAQFQFQFNFYTGIKQIIENNMNFVDALMKGFYLQARASVTSSAAKMLKQYLSKHFAEPAEAEKIILLMIKNVDLDIKIRTPQDLEKFFTKLGIWQLISGLPTLKDLIELLTPQLQTMKEQSEAGQPDQIPFFTAIRKLVKALATYSNTGIQICLAKANLVVFGYIEGQGLKRLHDMVFPK